MPPRHQLPERREFPSCLLLHSGAFGPVSDFLGFAFSSFSLGLFSGLSLAFRFRLGLGFPSANDLTDIGQTFPGAVGAIQRVRLDQFELPGRETPSDLDSPRGILAGYLGVFESAGEVTAELFHVLTNLGADFLSGDSLPSAVSDLPRLQPDAFTFQLFEGSVINSTGFPLDTPGAFALSVGVVEYSRAASGGYLKLFHPPPFGCFAAEVCPPEFEVQAALVVAQVSPYGVVFIGHGCTHPHK
ncbi:hypothetical protein [Nocardia thraciensis]